MAIRTTAVFAESAVSTNLGPKLGVYRIRFLPLKKNQGPWPLFFLFCFIENAIISNLLGSEKNLVIQTFFTTRLVAATVKIAIFPISGGCTKLFFGHGFQVFLYFLKVTLS